MGTLTVYTDASFNPETGVAGYGWWARDKNSPIEGSGIERDVRCNTYAEIRAIAYAIHKISKHYEIMFNGKIYCVVVTDSETARQYYNNPDKQTPFSDEPRNFVWELMKANSLDFRVNKVKAHSNKDGARSWVNRRVDKLASQARMKGEKLI